MLFLLVVLCQFLSLYIFGLLIVLCVFLCCCPGDEGSGSGSGSGCTEACVTEFDFASTEAPVVGADRSGSGPMEDSAAATHPAPSAALLASLALSVLALHRLWR